MQHVQTSALKALEHFCIPGFLSLHKRRQFNDGGKITVSSSVNLFFPVALSTQLEDFSRCFSFFSLLLS